jgi:hypothetical protein
MALHRWMGGNDVALKDAEKKVDALIAKYCLWLRTECCDMPTVFRFDAFLRRCPDGKTCDVFSGELTELGACTLGWDLPDMVGTLFPAVLSSMLDDKLCRSESCKCKSSAPCKSISVDRMVQDIRNRGMQRVPPYVPQKDQFEDEEEEEVEEGTDEGEEEEGSDGAVDGPSQGGQSSNGSKKKRKNKKKHAAAKA